MGREIAEVIDFRPFSEPSPAPTDGNNTAFPPRIEPSTADPAIRVTTGCGSVVSNTGLPAQTLWRLPIGAKERAPHVIAAREAALAGDVVDGVVPLLQHYTGGFRAQALDGFGGRAASRCLECAAELAWAEMRHLSQPLDGQRRTEVLLRVHQHALNSVGLRVHLQQSGVLRLPARATMVENELPGDEARQPDPQTFFDHCESRVDTGAGPRRRPHRGSDAEHPILIHFHSPQPLPTRP